MAKAYLYHVAQNQMIKLVDKAKVRHKHVNFISKTTHNEDPQFQMAKREIINSNDLRDFFKRFGLLVLFHSL